MSPSDFGRYWRTLRWLPLGQLAWLAWRRLAHMPRRVAPPRDAAPRAGVQRVPALPPARRAWLGGNRFEFLNEFSDFGETIDWSAAGRSRLWAYNLHYFDWLRQADLPAAVAAAQARHWVAHNQPFRGAGWEPYPTSLRLVNWTRVFDAATTESALRDSMALQASWLSHNLEHHLRANHLFVNLKALIFAGVWFDGTFGRRLLDRGWHLLERELAEQFLDDGGHYERSPMYHLLLTGDLLELCALVRLNAHLFPADAIAIIEQRAVAALGFARDLVLPGDVVPCFNDSTEGIAPRLSDLEEFARKNCGTTAMKQVAGRRLIERRFSGYYGVREGRDALLVDCGPIGPTYQPGHAHCDLLSFELCLDGERVIGNCGNRDYEAGAARSFARSTGAHNTVLVDGTEQSEMWGVFRVGRRARPIDAGIELGSADAVVFRGSHDGYRHLAGDIVHSREIRIGQDFTVRVRDRVSGRGEHAVTAWLHFAPACAAEYEQGRVVVSRRNQPLLTVEVAGTVSLDLVRTPRYPEFGRTEEGTSVRLSRRGSLPIEFECAILRLPRTS